MIKTATWRELRKLGLSWPRGVEKASVYVSDTQRVFANAAGHSLGHLLELHLKNRPIAGFWVGENKIDPLGIPALAWPSRKRKLSLYVVTVGFSNLADRLVEGAFLMMPDLAAHVFICEPSSEAGCYSWKDFHDVR